MKQKLKRAILFNKLLKNEFRRQLRMLITFALGLTIAFSWRETVFNLSKLLMKFFFNLKSDSTTNILASVFITLVALILIYIASHYLRDSPENYF